MNRKQRRADKKAGKTSAVGASADVERIFTEALSHHQEGRIQEAERRYQQVLAKDPRHADSLHLLGVIASQSGRHDLAIDLISKAVGVNAMVDAYHANLGLAFQELRRLDEAIASYQRALGLKSVFPEVLYNNLGNALRGQGRLDEAVANLRQAIALKADYPEAHTNLGNALHQQGQLDEAMACHRQAIALRPNLPHAHSHLGNVLGDLGRWEDAIACHRKALEIWPDYPEAHTNLGTALQLQGLLSEAIASHRRAITLKPGLTEAHINLGNSLRDQGQLGDAAACFNRALGLSPNHPIAYNGLGDVLWRQGRMNEAIASLRKAIEVDPAYPEGYSNLGNVLREQGQLAEAETCLRQAIALKPSLREAHSNLGNVLWGMGRVEEAIASLRRAVELTPDSLEDMSLLAYLRRQICDWDGVDSDIARALDLAEHSAQAMPPFIFLTLSSSPDLHLACARRWAAKIANAAPRAFTHARPEAKSKIRLGYLSADFRTHPVASLVVELIEKHDRSRFEVVGYSYGPDDGSEIRQRLVRAFDIFVDARDLAHEVLAQQIYDDGVDILIDLTGYTNMTRTAVLVGRPAPIQVNYLGYPGTMGADFVDYILVDSFVAPADQQVYFTEKLVHLPHCYQPNDSKRAIAETTPTRADCGLPDDAFVFCCFNNAQKITPQTFDLWMRILSVIPNGVLWLLGNDSVTRNLEKQAVARGVDPARLVFAAHMAAPEHLARHRLADLFLDTLPYNAHTTASDALWAGLPVLTLVGNSFAGRVAGSLLQAIGLPELMTDSEEHYLALAVELASNPIRLGQIRQKLADYRLTTPLFDIDRFTQGIEAAYAKMWQGWLMGESPMSFTVPPSSHLT